jgi:predicted membrane-bound mannosyltransferase
MSYLRATPLSRHMRLAIALVMLLGLGLRMAAATGGIWLDEAWSVVYARDVPPFFGVFSSINHDNNHHLNSLWLQLVGPSAPPIAMRLLSIISGTLSIGLAALITARRSQAAALISALLFALSPILVLYGSEARGYAPFVLAFLSAIFVIDRWLSEGGQPPRRALAVIAAFGILSHLLMVPALCALAAWVWLDHWGRSDWRAATRSTLDALTPAALTAATIMITIFGVARVVAGGMMVGGYEAFSWPLFGYAMTHLSSATTGIGAFESVSLITLCAALASIATLIAAGQMKRARLSFYAPLIAMMPVAVMLVQPGNTAFPRYYLVVAVGVLLIAGEAAGAAWERRSSFARVLAAAVICAWLGGSALQVRGLQSNQRGNASAAVAAMERMSPSGARVMIGHYRSEAALAVMSAQTHYPITTKNAATEQNCANSQFWFNETYDAVPRPTQFTACGTRWNEVAGADSVGLSGQSWSLYARQGLPSRMAAVNGPRPMQIE